MRSLATLCTVSLTLLLLTGTGRGQIERLTLDQMAAKTDGAVVGTIVKSKAFRVDHPIDGDRLYFTTLTIRGRSLESDRPLEIDVTFPGGFITPEEGVWNSEAPSADETRVGNRVVAFYCWVENMGGDVAANALYASHGGLYQVQGQQRRSEVVLGRGTGYAICSNCDVEELTSELRLARAR